MKIGTTVYKIVGWEVKEFYISTITRTNYKLTLKEDAGIVNLVTKIEFGSERASYFLSKIVALRTLEERLFKALVEVRKEVQIFRTNYLRENQQEYTDEDMQREAYNYDPEQIEGESI